MAGTHNIYFIKNSVNWFLATFLELGFAKVRFGCSFSGGGLRAEKQRGPSGARVPLRRALRVFSILRLRLWLRLWRWLVGACARFFRSSHKGSHYAFLPMQLDFPMKTYLKQISAVGVFKTNLNRELELSFF